MRGAGHHIGKGREAGTPEKMGWGTARGEDGEDGTARGDEGEG